MKQKEQNDTGAIYIGIDLGTSSSAIMSSNGKKNWVESYVGWPKDFIAQKVIGKPVLFGSEALQNRLSVDLFRPMEHGVIKDGLKDQESVKELIRHLITMAQKGKGGGIFAVVGVPAESFKANKLAIRNAVSGYVNSLMVVSEPFAVAYGMEMLNNTMVIDIGAGTVDFCIMHGTIPKEEDQRTITHAGDYIDEQLFNFLSERHPNSTFNKNMIRQFKEKHSFVGDIQAPVRVKIPVEGKPVEHDITEELKRACESILPAIIETAAEMIARFDPEYQTKIRNNIILAGGGSLIQGLPEYIERVLSEYGPSKVTRVDDPLFAGSKGALGLAMDMPAEYWEQM